MGIVCLKINLSYCLIFRVKEVEIGSEKALIVKENDGIFAFGSKCTHYGLPLGKGKFQKGCKFTTHIVISLFDCFNSQYNCYQNPITVLHFFNVVPTNIKYNSFHALMKNL